MSDAHESEILSMLSKEETQIKAFEQIVTIYRQKIYWHIRRMVIDHEDANDVTQEVFIKAWKSIANFKGETQIYTWLYRIATNESINFLNRKRKTTFIPFEEIKQNWEKKIDTSEYLSGTMLERKLQKAIMQLPDKQRAVFNLKYFDEMKYEEMSKVLDTSVGALKASYHHAVKKIEEYIKNH